MEDWFLDKKKFVTYYAVEFALYIIGSVFIALFVMLYVPAGQRNFVYALLFIVVVSVGMTHYRSGAIINYLIKERDRYKTQGDDESG